MLSRIERAKITMYVMKKLYPQCVKRKNLFSDRDAEDIMEDLGVHIWIKLMKYQRKSYSEATKIAYMIGVNRLTSIVRSKMTVVKRGAGTVMVRWDPEDMYWLYSKSMFSNGVQIIDAVESIISVAISHVGIQQADSLVKALLYDWRRKPSQQQVPIMEALEKNRKEVRKLVAGFIYDLKREMATSRAPWYDIPTLKVEGKWQQGPPNNTRKS